MNFNLPSNIDHEIFKALSEPIRLRIVALLTEGELCVCDIQNVLSLPQSTVSRHMSRLKTSGVVRDSRRGKWIYYQLSFTGRPLMTALADYFGTLKNKEPFAGDSKRLAQRHLKEDRCG
ncbi:MAG: metalloregulator ArsR/SmtB family transcription factor [Candidatus Zixiibacteriota bacterium]